MGKQAKKKIFKRKKSYFQKGFSFIKSLDMYGKDIVLTYKGDDKFRTHVGGLASVVVGTVILAYIVYLIFIMFTKGNTNISVSSLLNDVSKGVEVYQPGKDKFDFAFSYTASGVDYLADSTYFSFSMRQVEQKWVNLTGTSSIERSKTDIPFGVWGDSFSHDDQDEIKRLGIDEYYCPTSDEYSVAGTFFAQKFNYIEIKLLKCTTGTWKTNTEIEDVMKDARFSLAIENTVVDMNDYTNSVQGIVDDGFFWELVPGFRKKTDIYIRKNEASFEDGYVQLGFPEEKQFFQVAESSDSFESESTDGDILTIYFRYDKMSDIYERQIFSLAELLGQAGGFYGALLAIGSILIFIFSERLFVASILRKIYQIDTWQESQRLKKKSDRSTIYKK